MAAGGIQKVEEAVSRIGKQPVVVPANVKVAVDGKIFVEGPKGKLEFQPIIRTCKVEHRRQQARPSRSPGPTTSGSSRSCTA